MTTCSKTKAAEHPANLAISAAAHALTNAPADSQGHINGNVDVASMAGIKSAFVNKAGTSPITAAHPTSGLAATATILVPTTLAGPPMYDATLTVMPMSTAPGLHRVNGINGNENAANDDNTPMTGDLPTAHPISRTTLTSIPEVHNNSPTPPPWATQLEDHAK